MVDVVEIDPQDAMPNVKGDFIQIVRRFDPQQPKRAIIDIDLFIASKYRQSLADDCITGDPTDMQGVVRQAVEIAKEKDIGTIYVADLTATVRN